MDNVKIKPQMIITVTTTEKERDIKEIFKECGINLVCNTVGQGTAPSQMLDLFGLGGRTRLLSVGILPKCYVSGVFRSLEKNLSFSKKARGIAFTIPLNGLQGALLNFLNEEKNEKYMKNSLSEEGDGIKMKENSEYSAIIAGVVSGYAADAFEAAKKAGARGGTILKGSKDNSKVLSEKLGFSLKEEQEFVLMIVPKEKKKDIMTAINEVCGISSEAQGVIVSVPVEDVLGIE